LGSRHRSRRKRTSQPSAGISRSRSESASRVALLVGFACAYGLAAYLNPLTFCPPASLPCRSLCCIPVQTSFSGAAVGAVVIAWGVCRRISWSAVSCSANVGGDRGCLGRETCPLWGATVLWTLAFDTVCDSGSR
jgi:4-hydroxybenzoate polyprenyltransferase